MRNSGYYIVLDFDGTVVKHSYPAVGADIGAVPVLECLVRNGHQLILNTMRYRDCEGEDLLQPAVDWFAERNIPLAGINENPSQKEWTSSPKPYGQVYIDDAALGAPLMVDKKDGSRYIDWSLASVHLYYRGFLTDQDIVELIKHGTIRAEHIAKKY